MIIVDKMYDKSYYKTTAHRNTLDNNLNKVNECFVVIILLI